MNLKAVLGLEEVSGIRREDVEGLLVRVRLSDFLYSTAYDEEGGLYLCEDGYAGFVFSLYPKPMAGVETLTFLEKGIYQDPNLPENTLIQWLLWGNEHIRPLMDSYMERKEPEYRGLASIYTDFLLKHVREGFFVDWQCPVRDVQLYFAMKVPCGIGEYEKKQPHLTSIKEGIRSTLAQTGFYPSEVEPKELVFLYYLLFNPNHPKDAPVLYDEGLEIREQAVCRDTVVEQYDSFFRVDGACGKVLTVKKYPRDTVITDALEFVGSIQHLNRNQVNTPFVHALLLRKATDKEKQSKIASAELTAKQKGFSSLSKKLPERQEDFSYLTRELEDGSEMWKGSLAWYLYHDDLDYLGRSVQTLKNLMSQKGYELQEELVPLPFFIACTPLNHSRAITDDKLRRFSTYLSHNAAHLSPVQADWKGTGTPTVPLVSRRGQVVFVDLWDTDGGMNAAIVAPTGKGKSFYTNHLIFNYRTQPDTKVRVVDVGDSYYGICELFGGEYVALDLSNPICVNPFSDVHVPDLEMDFLVSIVAKMAKPTEAISDMERGLIEIAIRHAWQRYGKNTDITKVRDEIYRIGRDRGDDNLIKLADFNLAPWVEGGQYARFFNGKSEVDLDNRLVVFEFKNVKDDQKLINVLLLAFFYHLNKEIYTGDRSVRKLVIWDEAWRFLDNPEVLRFIQQGSREYRKFNGSLVTITQNMSDYNKNEVTRVLKANCEYLFVLWQPPEEWERLQEDKELYITDFEKELLRDTLQTVTPYYSEVFVISRGRGRGIARLVVPEKLYWLYTTKADEVALRQRYIRETGDIMEAVKRCIENRRQK